MKKILYSMGLMLMLGLASCGGSVDSKIDKFGELAKEAKEIQAEMIEGDFSNQERLIKITEEMGKLSAEIKKANLTSEQQERLVNASFGM